MIKYSFERLTHMQCGSCKQYFTIADKEPEGVMYCPSCNARNSKWEEMEPLKKPRGK